MKHDVFAVIQAAISSGVVVDEADSKRLAKLVDLLAAVRQQAIEDCAAVCLEMAGEIHHEYWQARHFEEAAKALSLADQRGVCERLKDRIRLLHRADDTTDRRAPTKGL